MKYFLLFFVSIVLTFSFIIVLRGISLSFKVFRTRDNVSYLGGVGVLLGFLISLFLFYRQIPLYLNYILFSSIVVFVVKVIDDLIDFSLVAKLLLQISIVVFFLSLGKGMQFYFLPWYLNYFFSFLWLMGIMNAFNLMDISDGLCGGVSLVIAFSFLGVFLIAQNILLIYLFISLCGALCAFLFFNFPPAKVFMGNSGSHFLGFLFGALSMYGDYSSQVNLFSCVLPVVILAFPIIDTLFLISIRLKKGIFPFKKSNDHIFLRLQSDKNDVRKILFMIYCVCVLWGVAGILIYVGWYFLFIVFLISAFLLTAKVIRQALVSYEV